jgi:PAS domain S-box-containing protein
MARDLIFRILQQSSSAWVLLDEEGSMLQINPAAAHLLGLDPAVIRENSFLDLFQESERRQLNEALNSLGDDKDNAVCQETLSPSKKDSIPLKIQIFREEKSQTDQIHFHVILEPEKLSGLEDIQWLSEQGKALLSLSAQEEVYDTAGRALKKKLGRCIVLTLSNVDSTTLKLEGVYGLDEGNWSRVQDLIGKRLVGRLFHIEERFQPIYRKRSLYHHTEGLEDFASTEVPELISRQLKKTYGIEEIYTIGLEGEQRVMGCLYMFTRVPGLDLDADLIETFSYQVALALEKTQFADDLRESEKQFQAVFEFAPDGYYITDPEGKFVDGNRAAEEITGYSREELIGQSFLTAGLISKRQLPKAGRLLAENLLGRSTGPDELTLTRKDGSTLPIEVSTHPVKIRDRSLVLGIARDISQRKQAARQLDQFENTLKLVLESIDAHIYVADLETNEILYMNQGMIDDFGEDFTGRFCPDVFGGYAKPCNFSTKEDLLDEEGNPASVQVWESDDQIFGKYFVYHDRAIHWADERLARLQIGLDITKNRQATEALRASEERYRKLFDSSQDALMTIAPPEWKITSGNPALQDLFRIEDEGGFLGRKPWELSPEYQPDELSSREKALQVIEQAMEYGFSYFQWIHQKIDGEEFPAEVQLTRVDADQGAFLQATIKDITEREYSRRILDQQMDDLALLNTLNQGANQGKTLEEFIHTLKIETRKIFSSRDTSIYLLDEPGEMLRLENPYLEEGFRKSIQRLIGVEISGKIEIPLDKTEFYQKIISEGQPRIIVDPDIIQRQIADFTQAAFLPDAVRSTIRELVPRIYNLTGIGSVISAPLISKGRVIGLMEMSGTGLFTEDVKDRFSSLADQVSGIIERLRAERDRAANIQELELINRLFVEGSRLEDIDEICLMLAERIQEVNPDAYVMISLYDPAQDAIRVRALTGLGNRADRIFDLFGVKPTELQVSVAEFDLDQELQELFTSGSMVRVPQGIYDLTRGKYPRSVCRTAERLLGVGDTFITGFGLGQESTGGVTLFVRRGSEVQFKSAIETIVSHFSVIIDRRQSESEVKQRTAQLQALREVELDITSQLNLQDLLYSIAGRASQIVEGQASGFSIYNPEADVIEFQSYTGEGPLPPKTIMEKGEGLAGKVWENQETLVVQDYANWEGRDQRWAELLGDYNVVGIPVEWGADFLGVLEIGFDPDREIGQEEIGLLELFATQAAIAIQNARLYSGEQKRRREAETLREVGLLINQIMDRSDLLDMILENLQKVVPYDSASIQLVHGPDLIVEAFRGHQGLGDAIGKRFSIKEDKLVHPVLYEGKKIILDDVTNVVEWIVGPETEGVKSWIAVPLEVKGRRFGVLTLDHMQEAVYTERDADLAFNFAAQAALAIENNQLIDDLQGRTQELEAIYESSLVISQELQPDLLFEHLRIQVERLFNPDAFIIAGFDTRKQAINISYATESGKRLVEAEGQEVSPEDDTGLLSWLVRNRSPLLVGNVESDTLPVKPRQIGKPLLSWLGVPLMVGDSLIGALAIQSFESNAYSKEDLRLLELLASQAAIALENSRLFEEAQRRLSRITSLREIDTAISGSIDLPTTLEVLISQLILTLEVDAACVLHYKPVLQTLDFVSGRGFQTEALRSTSLKLGSGHAGKAALERRKIIILDLKAQDSTLFKAGQFAQEGFVSYIGIPLIAKGDVVGVLEVFHRSRLDPDPEWFYFLESLAGQAAIAIDRLNLYNDLERSNVELIQAYDATIEGWARAVELRDGDTEGHSRRVVQLTLDLARKMGISGKKLADIRRGALLHDIGKMAVPDRILLKPGKLTEEEWIVMKEHPVFAYEMLSSIEYLRPALDIPYSHHERWDGSGYPRGMAGEAIPLAARIFAVVDVWDALQSDRPYRPAWSRQKALAYLEESAGTQFDPAVVKAFIKLVQNASD